MRLTARRAGGGKGEREVTTTRKSREKLEEHSSFSSSSFCSTERTDPHKSISLGLQDFFFGESHTCMLVTSCLILCI